MGVCWYFLHFTFFIWLDILRSLLTEKYYFWVQILPVGACMRCGKVRTGKEIQILTASDFSCCLSRSPYLHVKVKLVQEFRGQNRGLHSMSLRNERKNVLYPQTLVPQLPFPQNFFHEWNSTSYQNAWNSIRPTKLKIYENSLICQILGINIWIYLNIYDHLRTEEIKRLEFRIYF